MKVFVIIAFLLLTVPASYAQPSIVFDAEKYDFGKASDYYLEHAFTFTNAGTEDLVIEKVVPS
jgi:hypothetical protein